MRRNIFCWFIVCSLFCVQPFWGQVANELNERSKELLAKKKYAKAWPLLKDAARLGNPEAQYNLGNAYETGTFIRKSLTASTDWYAKSAEQGYTDAIYKMMLAYRYGLGIEADPEQAFDFAQQCAEAGNIDCMHHLVGCYREGWATDRDPSKMVEQDIR